jgi:hypothetical protein
MARASTWTNADGLVVGFGTNTPEVTGAVSAAEGGLKTAHVVFDYLDTGVNIPVPAGSEVIAVYVEVGSAWLGGTRITVGDGTDPDGFVTEAQGATANLLAGAKIVGSGAYTKATTDTTAQEHKLYSTADTIDVTITGTFTAGTATLTVVYA